MKSNLRFLTFTQFYCFFNPPPGCELYVLLANPIHWSSTEPNPSTLYSKKFVRKRREKSFLHVNILSRITKWTKNFARCSRNTSIDVHNSTFCSPKQFSSNIFIFPPVFVSVCKVTHIFRHFRRNLCPPVSTHLKKTTIFRAIGQSSVYAEFFATSSINQDTPFGVRQNLSSEMTFVNDKKTTTIHSNKKEPHSNGYNRIVSIVSRYFSSLLPHTHLHIRTFDSILPLIFHPRFFPLSH